MSLQARARRDAGGECHPPGETCLPPSAFARLVRFIADPFQVLCVVVDALGVRRYARVSRDEADLAVLDILGAPQAHSLDEVTVWYHSEGFTKVWGRNDNRGFGVCGQRDGDAPPPSRR